MSRSIVAENATEADVRRFAEDVAFLLAPGDTLALEGDLGAGKTTFARALIGALTDTPAIEVPSPTFTLVQGYRGPRFEIAHFDLYRLKSPDELEELGFDAASSKGIAIVEWPAHGGEALADPAFTLALSPGTTPCRRTLTLRSSERNRLRLERAFQIRSFLASNGWNEPGSHLAYLQGDASQRRYARLRNAAGDGAILMDSPRQADGPPVRDGKPYSQIAHLAEDVRAFVAIGDALHKSGFSSPVILAHDLDNGLLLIEDFGNAVFGPEVARGQNQAELWGRGVKTLAALRQVNPAPLLPLPDGLAYALPRFDLHALLIEAELLLDWYWPMAYGTAIRDAARAEFQALWTDIAARLLSSDHGWMLRDFHSPNLLALSTRPTPRDTGIIDFQDALIGPRAYDLVSLLQDARLDCSEALEKTLREHYIAQVLETDATFNKTEFERAYSALGAQRNTKILGIFARLAKRDGKRQYLAHLPRIWGYLERNLDHPELAALRAWYNTNFPLEVRRRDLTL